MPTERKHREEIVRYGRMLHERSFVAAFDGNLSVRLKGDRILVTPTCVSKGAMRPADLVIVDLEGKRVAGHRNVTSEIGMHLLIYRTRPDVQAIVHAHPPTATGFAAAGMPLTEPLVCEVVMGLGCIPLARYGTPGTSELAQTLEPYVPSYDAILMSNHGVVTYGDTLRNFYSSVLPASNAVGRTSSNESRRSDLICALPMERERGVFKSASGFSRTSETIRKSCALLTSTRRRQEGLCVRVDGRERRGLKPVL